MRRRLVTWSLVLPFSLGPVAYADRVILSDQLLFRLNTRAIFFVDLLEYSDYLKTFHCLYPQSVLLKTEDFKPSDWELLKTISPSSDLNPHRPLILKFKRLLMRQVYANNQNLSVERDFDRSLALSKCEVARFETWPQELQSLVQAELFWLEATPQVEFKKIQSVIVHEILF
jgi:hypothetical protein